MSLLDQLFGSDEQTAQTETKYAILLNAGPDETPVAGNAFNYALTLDGSGYETELFLDGEATKWPAAFSENPDRPYNHDWERIEQRGILAGVCGYCANAFDVVEECRSSGVELLSDSSQHAPAIKQLAEQQYEIITL